LLALKRGKLGLDIIVFQERVGVLFVQIEPDCAWHLVRRKLDPVEALELD
jgi:hypothetical protein